MPKTKAKDMRPVALTWEGRYKPFDVLLPVISDVLGVEFDFDVPTAQGIELSWSLKWKPGSISKRFEYEWAGHELVLQFWAAGNRKVTRRLPIAPGADLDADRLRDKWAEILALKAEDDQLRAARKAAMENSEAAKAALLAEVEGLGEGQCDHRWGNQWEATATRNGFNANLKRLTPEQLRAIVAIVEGE